MRGPGSARSAAPRRALRAAALLGATVLATEGVRRLVAGPLRTLVDLSTTGDALASVPLGDLVAGACALALAACWAWLVACTVLVSADALRHDRPVVRAVPWCPHLVRLLVLTTLGVAVGTGPAVADSGSGPGVLGLALPDRVMASTAPAGSPAPPRLVRVRRGDTLWSIASRRLPASAPDAAVTRAWRRLAAANPNRVDDPDLIFPGTVLRVPDLGHALGKES